ncbi:hypothetical protein AAMO2058_000910100 [Amorphochlora amoebiformis]
MAMIGKIFGPRKFTGPLEHACVFMIAVGVSIGFTCVLAAVNYFSITLFNDRKEFLYLCLAVYLPSLPAVMFQLKYDRMLDRWVGSRNSFGFRAAVYYISMGLIMIYLPIGPASPEVREEPTWYRQPPLLIGVTILGTFSAFSYGTFFQLVSFLPSRNGTCTAVFSMGYQGAGIIALILALLIGFRTKPSDLQVKAFFWAAGALEFLAGIAYLVLAQWSTVFNVAIDDRDYEASEYRSMQSGSPSMDRIMTPVMASKRKQMGSLEIKSPVVPTKASEGTTLLEAYELEERDTRSDIFIHTGSGSNIVENYPKLEEDNDWNTFTQVAPCVLSIFLNIFASVFLLPFYTFFQTNSPKLPQALFFTKLLSDTIGRPMTLLLPKIMDQKVLLALSGLRICFLAIFLANILGCMPLGNTEVIFLVGIFSAGSGFIGTSAYQLAPSLVTGSFNKSQVANMLNFAFHLAVAVALLTSAVLTHLLDFIVH